MIANSLKGMLHEPFIATIKETRKKHNKNNYLDISLVIVFALHSQVPFSFVFSFNYTTWNFTVSYRLNLHMVAGGCDRSDILLEYNRYLKVRYPVANQTVRSLTYLFLSFSEKWIRFEMYLYRRPPEQSGTSSRYRLWRDISHWLTWDNSYVL